MPLSTAAPSNGGGGVAGREMAVLCAGMSFIKG